jgi:hypothetical protein
LYFSTAGSTRPRLPLNAATNQNVNRRRKGHTNHFAGIDSIFVIDSEKSRFLRDGYTNRFGLSLAQAKSPPSFKIISLSFERITRTRESSSAF